MNKLEQYFEFWDRFVQQWCYQNSKGFSLNHFQWPSGLKNSDKKEDFSQFYLPEPYWGWTGTGKLEMVVLNYNPGSGRPVQHIDRFASLSNFSYQSFVKDQIDQYSQNKCKAPFKVTCNWHYVNRRDPLAAFLTLKEYAIPVGYHNHLSIELIPWHTKGIDSIMDYLINNRTAINKYSLQFAIEACKKIANPILRNKLIIRTKWKNFQEYLGIPDGFRLKSEQKVEPVEKIIYNCVTLVNEIGIQILIIWGNISRNKLPPPETLVKLIT